MRSAILRNHLNTPLSRTMRERLCINYLSVTQIRIEASFSAWCRLQLLVFLSLCSFWLYFIVVIFFQQRNSPQFFQLSSSMKRNQFTIMMFYQNVWRPKCHRFRITRKSWLVLRGGESLIKFLRCYLLVFQAGQLPPRSSIR